VDHCKPLRRGSDEPVVYDELVGYFQQARKVMTGKWPTYGRLIKVLRHVRPATPADKPSSSNVLKRQLTPRQSVTGSDSGGGGGGGGGVGGGGDRGGGSGAGLEELNARLRAISDTKTPRSLAVLYNEVNPRPIQQDGRAESELPPVPSSAGGSGAAGAPRANPPARVSQGQSGWGTATAVTEGREVGGGGGGGGGGGVSSLLGRAVQVAAIKPMVKAPGMKRLNPTCDELLSNFALYHNLRRYNKVVSSEETAECPGALRRRSRRHQRQPPAPALATHSACSVDCLGQPATHAPTLPTLRRWQRCLATAPPW
jgi:hypothetical protein